MAALLAGFACTGWLAALRLDDALASGLNLVVTGVVASLPQQGPSGLRFRFEIDPEARRNDAAELPPRVALGWYSGLHEDAALRATGYVRDAPPPELLHEAAGYPVERLRQRVRDATYANVADRRAAGVLAALAVGDQGAIERDDWDLFRNTGVAHLMSISGL
ncbi:MAG: ComEC/Rec2 family competence protein, partial [Caldimonas sp.]